MAVITINPTEATGEDHVVVLGDFMIDETWIISEVPADTAQAHAEITPRKRLKPTWSFQRPGGAGATLMALWALRELHDWAFSLHGIGVWGTGSPTFRSVTGLTDADNVSFHPLRATNPVTTRKVRYYAKIAHDEPRLLARYDQDPIKFDPTKPHSEIDATKLEDDTIDLPPAGEIRAIIVADFNKGAVTTDTLQALCDYLEPEQNHWWIIDSKRADILDDIPEDQIIDFLSLNRDEATRLLEKLSGDKVYPLPRGQQPNLELLTLLQKLRDCDDLKHSSIQNLIVKLDDEGACAMQLETEDDKVDTVFVKPLKKVKRSPGIAAGDYFNAQLLLSTFDHNSALDKEPKKNAMVVASAAASTWLEYCRDYWTTGVEVEYDDGTKRDFDNYGADHKSDIIKAQHFELDAKELGYVVNGRFETKKQGLDTPFSLADKLKDLQRPLDYSRIVKENAKLDLSQAVGFLGQFISTDLKLRAEIRNFVEKIKSYTKGKGKSKPLNCLVVAEPGSGKSFFVSQVAEETKCQVVEVNCSQALSAEDLLKSIARLQNVDEKKTPLLFLDEVDTDPRLYPYLLAPLWDSSVIINGEVRKWRKRMVSILVASNADNTENYIAELPAATKGQDLLSRLSGPRLTLSERGTSPGALTSRVYLLVQKIIEYHGSSRIVERGLLDLVYCAPQFNPRIVEHFVIGIDPPTDGVVTLKCAGLDRIAELATHLGYDMPDAMAVSGFEISRSKDLEYGSSDTILLEDLKRDEVRLIISEE